MRSSGIGETTKRLLQQAVTAAREALKQRTRDRLPLGWAETQTNLADALLALGLRESGTALLEEAVAAYRTALEERTRDRMPLAWAETQRGLANALAALAMRQQSAARMEEALTSMLGAVEVYQQSNDDYWLPIAKRRVMEMEVGSIELKTRAVKAN